ncbi:MAG: DUF2818 family protein [Proteobacteria bacterium]|nr:DUF2818 family protein [Pseudomonadota bacterium]
MDVSLSAWFIILLAALAANLPFLNERFLAFLPLSSETKPIWMRLIELALLYLLVGIVAAVLAWDPNAKVLELVSHAWAGFGAAFGPLIILALTWRRMTGSGAVAGLVVGAATVVGWILLGWNESFMGGPGIYEIIPGFAAAWAAIYFVSLAAKDRVEFRALPEAA